MNLSRYETTPSVRVVRPIEIDGCLIEGSRLVVSVYFPLDYVGETRLLNAHVSVQYASGGRELAFYSAVGAEVAAMIKRVKLGPDGKLVFSLSFVDVVEYLNGQTRADTLVMKEFNDYLRSLATVEAAVVLSECGMRI